MFEKFVVARAFLSLTIRNTNTTTNMALPLPDKKTNEKRAYTRIDARICDDEHKHTHKSFHFICSFAELMADLNAQEGSIYEIDISHNNLTIKSIIKLFEWVEANHKKFGIKNCIVRFNRISDPYDDKIRNKFENGLKNLLKMGIAVDITGNPITITMNYYWRFSFRGQWIRNEAKKANDPNYDWKISEISPEIVAKIDEYLAYFRYNYFDPESDDENE